LEINKTVIVASRWLLYYLTYIDDAWSNTNQGNVYLNFKNLDRTTQRPQPMSDLNTSLSVVCRDITDIFLKDRRDDVNAFFTSSEPRIVTNIRETDQQDAHIFLIIYFTQIILDMFRTGNCSSLLIYRYIC